jgi:hypothetical protein
MTASSRWRDFSDVLTCACPYIPRYRNSVSGLQEPLGARLFAGRYQGIKLLGSLRYGVHGAFGRACDEAYAHSLWRYFNAHSDAAIIEVGW